jgi:hypothetical protein
MEATHWQRLVNRFRDLPGGCRYAPATEQQLREFEGEFGKIPQEFRQFLIDCGGGTIGCEWVDGIAELVKSHRKFGEASAVPNGYKMKNVFVIGFDGWGNPFGVDLLQGEFWSKTMILEGSMK